MKLLISRARTLALVPVLLGLLTTASPLQGADARPISEFDLLSFTWIADPQISPDGTQVAFVRVTVNAKRDGYDTALWIVPTTGGEPRRLTAGPRDASPRWSPDSRQLAFIRAPEEGGRPQPAQIFLLSMAGGEARQLTKLPRGAGSPMWSPDGTRLAFSSNTMPKDLDKPAAPADSGGDAAAEQARRTSDVRVITRAVYRSNGGGYLDPTRRTSVWTIAVPGAAGSSAGAAGAGGAGAGPPSSSS